jgi:hypothetical protein
MLITKLVEQRRPDKLMSWPLGTSVKEVDAILEGLCKKIVNIQTGPPYHKVLHAFRISQNNYRGAAAILYERGKRLKSHTSTPKNLEELRLNYTITINALACVSEDQQWIFSEDDVSSGTLGSSLGMRESLGGSQPPQGKRKLLTIEDIRKEMQQELDRQNAIESGSFPFDSRARQSVDEDDEMEL